jgi:hypothetical protein
MTPSMTLRSMPQDGQVAQVPAGPGWGEAVPRAAVGEVKLHSLSLRDFNARLLIPREFFYLRAKSSEPGGARADHPRRVLRRDTSP